MRIVAQLRAIIKGCRRRPPLRKKRAALALTSVWPLWLQRDDLMNSANHSIV
jgi:hypothetical protein